MLYPVGHAFHFLSKTEESRAAFFSINVQCMAQLEAMHLLPASFACSFVYFQREMTSWTRQQNKATP